MKKFSFEKPRLGLWRHKFKTEEGEIEFSSELLFRKGVRAFLWRVRVAFGLIFGRYQEIQKLDMSTKFVSDAFPFVSGKFP